jgi:mRNA interferase MazF
MKISPIRGEMGLVDLNPVKGQQQAGRSPVLIVSVDPFNASAADFVVAIPITSTVRALRLHVVVQPPKCSLMVASEILCAAVRSISKYRLRILLGS